MCCFKCIVPCRGVTRLLVSVTYYQYAGMWCFLTRSVDARDVRHDHEAQACDGGDAGDVGEGHERPPT